MTSVNSTTQLDQVVQPTQQKEKSQMRQYYDNINTHPLYNFAFDFGIIVYSIYRIVCLVL